MGHRATHRVTPCRSRARVTSRRRVADETWWIELDSPEIAAASQPGQFVMFGLGLEEPGVFLLPRPFSVAWRSEDGRVGLLLRVFGEGTRRLARLEPGEEALLLGPLGRPFRLAPGRPIECVAGGVGLAPFIFLAAELTAASAATPDTSSPFRLLYGERSESSLFDPNLLGELTGVTPELFTEDGSAGRQGFVTEGIGQPVDPTGAQGADHASNEALLLACGPTPMLHAVVRLAAERGRELQVSVEEHMACGIGTCQGCVVPAADGSWIKSCVEGPVFDATELAWPT
jgi:dihydroorotate dehydrogenase electron transfer subunit